MNDTDRIIETAANRYRLIVPFERPASTAEDALVGSWDIVLDGADRTVALCRQDIRQ